jgi:hypothetical protein
VTENKRVAGGFSRKYSTCDYWVCAPEIISYYFIALGIMLDKDDPLYTAKKALKDTKKAVKAAEKSFKALKRLHKAQQQTNQKEVVEDNDFSIKMQAMLQNSRNNIEKMKELSRRLNNNSL